MVKIILLWLITMISVMFLIGGGIWFFFWAYAKAKKNKII